MRRWLALLLVFAHPPVWADAQKTVDHIAAPLAFDHIDNTDGLPNTDVKSIVQDRYGFLWFGTQDGLARYDGREMRVYRPNEADPTSISGAYITAVTLDADGKLWVGTAENGVDLYDPQTDKFTRFERKAKAKADNPDGVTAIARDAKNRMWFALSGGGLTRYEPSSNGFTEFSPGAQEGAITAIVADKAGNLWLGTPNDGVIRWNPDDPKATLTYKPSRDERGLGNAQITAILVASTGRVWIASDGDGLVSLDPASGKLVHYRHNANDPTTINDDHVSALFEDKHNNLWIGTQNGLAKLDKNDRIVQYNHDPNDPTSLAFPGVETVFEDAGGVMWIGGFTGGACKFDALRPKFGRYRTQTHPANSFLEEPDGTLWVGTYYGGLYKYEWKEDRQTIYRELSQAGEPTINLAAGWISALHRDKRGTLWIALKGSGLIAFDPAHETYKLYAPNPDQENSLPVDTIWSIWEDPRGALWLATGGGGLVKFSAQDGFSAITTESKAGLTSDQIYTIYPDPKEQKVLWLGTSKGGLVRFDYIARTSTSFHKKNDDPNSLASDDVLTIYRDKTGIVWVGTYGGGLNRLEPDTGKVERFTSNNSSLTNDVVLGILPDEDDKLWLSTNGGGLVQFDPKTKAFLVYDQADGVQNNEFGQGAFMRAPSGKLYFGGVGGFNAFLPKDITRDTYAPPVVMTAFTVINRTIKLDKPIWTLPQLDVSYSDSFELQFAALSFAAPNKNRYAYKLEGFDDKFIETDRPFARYTKLDGGSYTLRVRASNRHGVPNETGIAIHLSVKPPWWRTWPAFAMYVVVLAAAIFILLRMQQQKVRRIQRESRLAVVERDLALSGAVQSGFLPEYNEIRGAHLQLYGFYRAADACSGDWWWHEVFDNRHVVLVGDVTGHGPGPAMVTAAVATAFRVLVASGLGDVSRALELLNDVVLHVSKGKYHMTMAAIELDDSTGRWVLHSAGAPPMLSLDGSGKHKVHFCPGTPLGTETEFEIGVIDGQLAPGERLLIYTDGIPEITLPNGTVLGLRRFAQMYERTRNQTLNEAAAALVQLAMQTQSGQEQADDWTFTLLEWGSGPMAQAYPGVPSTSSAPPGPT